MGWLLLRRLPNKKQRGRTMTDCIWLDLLGVFAIALGIATMMLWRWV